MALPIGLLLAGFREATKDEAGPTTVAWSGGIPGTTVRRRRVVGVAAGRAPGKPGNCAKGPLRGGRDLRCSGHAPVKAYWLNGETVREPRHRR